MDQLSCTSTYKFNSKSFINYWHSPFISYKKHMNTLKNEAKWLKSFMMILTRDVVLHSRRQTRSTDLCLTFFLPHWLIWYLVNMTSATSVSQVQQIKSTNWTSSQKSLGIFIDADSNITSQSIAMNVKGLDSNCELYRKINCKQLIQVVIDLITYSGFNSYTISNCFTMNPKLKWKREGFLLVFSLMFTSIYQDTPGEKTENDKKLCN